MQLLLNFLYPFCFESKTKGLFFLESNHKKNKKTISIQLTSKKIHVVLKPVLKMIWLVVKLLPWHLGSVKSISHGDIKPQTKPVLAHCWKENKHGSSSPQTRRGLTVIPATTFTEKPWVIPAHSSTKSSAVRSNLIAIHPHSSWRQSKRLSLYLVSKLILICHSWNILIFPWQKLFPAVAGRLEMLSGKNSINTFQFPEGDCKGTFWGDKRKKDSSGKKWNKRVRDWGIKDLLLEIIVKYAFFCVQKSNFMKTL